MTCDNSSTKNNKSFKSQKTLINVHFDDMFEKSPGQD